MIVNFQQNPIARGVGIIQFSFRPLLFMTVYSSFVYAFNLVYPRLSIPVTPVSLLGVGLSIFLGFKNNAAYDRWWEARKIWGGIVNASRTFAAQVMTFISLHHGAPKEKKKKIREFQKKLIYRHIAWLNALRLNLRRQSTWEELDAFLEKDDAQALKAAKNKPTMINHQQAVIIQEAYEMGLLDSYHRIELLNTLKEFYSLQGMCERIKNTPLPRYYSYFTRLFWYFYAGILPFTLLEPFGRYGVLLSVLIAYAFWLIEGSGRLTADPFENIVTDTPMTALCRTIEIDMRQQLGETELPPPLQPVDGVLM